MVQEAARYGKLQKIYLSESLYAEIEKENFPEENDAGGGKGYLTEENSVHGEQSCLEEKRIGKWKKQLDLLEEYDYEVIAEPVFRKVSDTVTPQGMLGLATIPRYSPEELLQFRKRYYLLLDDVRDPGNLGTMVRTAEGAGMSGIILSHGSVDLFNPKVVRATMGAVFRMPYWYVDSLPEIIRQIRNGGCQVYATAMEGSVVYDEPDYTEGAAVVVGNEANGISDAVFWERPVNIRIPMEGNVESLNAAVSAAVIMYEINRQNRHGRRLKKRGK